MNERVTIFFFLYIQEATSAQSLNKQTDCKQKLLLLWFQKNI
jgi:hypothetical protein